MSAATTTRTTTLLAAIVTLIASMMVIPQSPAVAEVDETDFDGRFNVTTLNINDSNGGFTQNDAGGIGDGGTLDVIDVGEADLNNIHINVTWDPDADGDMPPVEQGDVDMSYCSVAYVFSLGSNGFGATCNSPGTLGDIDQQPLSVTIDIDDDGAVHQQTIELGTYTVTYPDLTLDLGDVGNVQLDQIDPVRYSFELAYEIGNGYRTNSADVTVDGIAADCITGSLTGSDVLPCTVDDPHGDLNLPEGDAEAEMIVDAVNAPSEASDTTLFGIDLDPSVDFDVVDVLTVDGVEFEDPTDVIVGAHVTDGLDLEGSFTVTNDGNMVLTDVLSGIYGEVQLGGANDADENVTSGLCEVSTGTLPVDDTLTVDCGGTSVTHTDGFTPSTLANLGPYPESSGGEWFVVTDSQRGAGVPVGFMAYIVDGGLDFDAELSDGDNTFYGSAAFDTVLAEEWVVAHPDVDTDVTDTVVAINLGTEDGPSVGTPSALERNEAVEFSVSDIDADVDVTTAYVTFDVTDQQRWGTGEGTGASGDTTITVAVDTGLTYDDGSGATPVPAPTPPDENDESNGGDDDSNGDDNGSNGDDGPQRLAIDCVDQSADFDDVDADATHAAAIACLGGDDGLFQGDEDGLFHPDGTLTRGQVASVLHRALARAGVDIDGSGHSFEDVPNDAAHGEAIGALTAAGLAKGYDDRTFGPHDAVSRGQLATLLDRAERIHGVEFDRHDDHGFVDVPAGSTHNASIGALTAAGIIEGYGDGTFAPHDPISREQAAAMFTRWLTNGGDSTTDD